MGFRSSPEESLPHTRASASKIWCLVMVLPRPQGFHGNAMLINVAVVYKKVLDICTYVYTISYMYIHYIRYTNYKYNVQYIWCYIYIYTHYPYVAVAQKAWQPPSPLQSWGWEASPEATYWSAPCLSSNNTINMGNIWWNILKSMLKYGEIWWHMVTSGEIWWHILKVGDGWRHAVPLGVGTSSATTPGRLAQIISNYNMELQQQLDVIKTYVYLLCTCLVLLP